ncbi:c-type cytochrome [Ruegeria arenilitoris]|uniref:c-type cytochrome n=1 Tax=Ruegeria arenilitoris TaxID=1173585 RepID=UPI00147CC968|nr:cytochrome c [Ruegeria arenilitoris]
MLNCPMRITIFAMVFTLPSNGIGQELDPQTAAGKAIYEAETHRVGCRRCHAADGTAVEEGKSFMAERSIQGKSAEEIRVAIMASPMMWTIKLNEEELLQLAAYLKHLEAVANQ